MRLLFVLGVVACSALAGPPYKGRKVTWSETAVPLATAFETLADIGKVNVVWLSPTAQTVNLSSKNTPWDQVLDELISDAKLASRREGNVVVVGTPEEIAKRGAFKWTMKRVTLTTKGAAGAAASEALARSCSCEPPTLSGGKPLTIELRNAPADQAVALIKDVTGATEASRARPTGEKCLAAATSVTQLQLVGLVTGTVQPQGILADPAGKNWVVSLKDCVGKESDSVKRITPNTVVLAGGIDFELGGFGLPADRAREETVAIDALLQRMESVDAGAVTGHRQAMERKRALLVFMRDVLGLKSSVEDLSPDALWTVSSSSAQQLDAAIIGGAKATPEKVAAIPELASSELMRVWVARESKVAGALEAELEAEVARRERDVKDLLELLTAANEGKPVTTFDEPVPPSLAWLKSVAKPKSALASRIDALIKRYR